MSFFQKLGNALSRFMYGRNGSDQLGWASLVLLLVLPLFAVFTRHVQKRMLAAQLDNRRAVAAVSGQVPETLHLSLIHI